MEKNKGGRPRKFQSLEELADKINEYFNYCDSKKEEVVTNKGIKIIEKPYTISGLCVFLDITRETLIEYSKIEEFSNTIKKAKLKIESYAENKLFSKDCNPIGIIFNLKNNFKENWKDKQEVEQNINANINVKKLEDLL